MGISLVDIQKQTTKLERVVSQVLIDDDVVSEQLLHEQISLYRPIAAPDLTDEQVSAVIRTLMSRMRVDIDLGVAITSEHFVRWLDQMRASVEWRRWLTYKQLMLKNGLPPKVIDVMDESTDEILEFAGDPNLDGVWARSGLVIGDVQSGKTATYLAILNKAADVGYKLIIVLAGSTESLRQQTQVRVDEGFIGRDSRLNISAPGNSIPEDKYVGVGQFDKSHVLAQGMTTAFSDFRKKSNEVTNFSIDEMTSTPHIFVLKKNKSVLNAVHEWLSQQPSTGGKLNIPMLLLDDESDYASVNTKDETNPTAINEAIRNILGIFNRSSYLAFTATPFANIFIDHDVKDDLFPRDYIFALEAPTNYVGAVRTFGTSDDVAQDNLIELYDAQFQFPFSHKSDLEVASLPDSLHEALRVFALANAIRDLRGDSGGRSMLINVSRFKRVQAQVFDLVDAEFSALRNSVELHALAHSTGSSNADMDRLSDTFHKHFKTCGFEWSDVVKILAASVKDVRVQVFNSDRDKKLDLDHTSWEKPRRLIAVGGDVLSRGLTLDGLMTSYFYRRAGASDTLLQMGRWFGYRDGYEDLCRLWIDPGVAADYRFVHESVVELRDDLRLMKRQKLTPSDFGLAVKKHPGTLLVTARNKMKSADTREKTISLIGRRIETTKLSSSAEVIRDNFSAFTKLIDRIEAEHGPMDDSARATSRGYPSRTDVSKEIVADFLSDYAADRTDEIFSQSAIGKFVRYAKSPSLQHWQVVLVRGRGKNLPITETLSLALPIRRIDMGGAKELRVSGKSSRLAGSQDIESLVPADVVSEVATEFHELHPDRIPPELLFYAHLRRPVLMVYPLQPEPTGVALKAWESANAPALIAIKVAIPGDPINVNDTSGDVKYYINTVAQQNWLTEFTSKEMEDEVDG
jgi:hypothetical protein